jgi:hypothetical protein
MAAAGGKRPPPAQFTAPVKVHALSPAPQRALGLLKAIERQRLHLHATLTVEDPPRAAAAAAGADVAAGDAPADGCWIEYFVGSSALVLASPHDGRLEPRWAARRDTDTVTVRDKGATAVACHVALALAAASPAAPLPHVVLCHVSRSVVDVNRPLAEGAGACPRGRAVWLAYHAALADALGAARGAHRGRELFADLHAQGNFGQNGGRDLLECGYLLPLAALAADPPDADASSLRRLWSARRRAAAAAGAPAPPGGFGTVLRSLGELLRARGVDAVPRLHLPAPPPPADAATARAPAGAHGGRPPPPPPHAKRRASAEPGGARPAEPPLVLRRYFCGQRSYTLRHVVDALGADGVQLELPVRASSEPTNWRRLGEALAGALDEWCALQYGCSLSGGATHALAAADARAPGADAPRAPPRLPTLLRPSAPREPAPALDRARARRQKVGETPRWQTPAIADSANAI